MSTSKFSHNKSINLSVVDLFSVGLGPSSSHTVGPMRAGYQFCEQLRDQGLLDQAVCLRVDLFGSLALTGRGHGTDRAVLLGLSGLRPRSIDPDVAQRCVEYIREFGRLNLGGYHEIAFFEEDHIHFNFDEILPEHPNAMRIAAFNALGQLIQQQTYFSVGGGFIVSQNQHNSAEFSSDEVQINHPFSTGQELLEHCDDLQCRIADLMLLNESAWRPEKETLAFIDHIWSVMGNCIDRGLKTDGILPGGFNVKRRAKDLYKELSGTPKGKLDQSLKTMDWVNLFALAVSEENAAGGRVVTAPTNGAAGIIPAVLRYYEGFCDQASQEGIRTFLLTAAAIGVLYKKRASISGAEVGCQGEVGVACSMAAAGLCAALGGTNRQVENAAEIGMEHNLGLTCDPVGGLVQIPCIERNAIGAVKAINAARLAMRGDGEHMVSLDKVIETMRQTGEDMNSKYKETAQGGLAVNVIAC